MPLPVNEQKEIAYGPLLDSNLSEKRIAGVGFVANSAGE
jgi:hypothetical protein